MFERFTDRARRVVVLALEEANRVGAGQIESEHLLLGLLAEGQSAAARTLTERGVKRESLTGAARRLQESVPSDAASVDAPPDAGGTGSTRIAPSTIAVVDEAREGSKRLGHEFVAPEHLLLGLLEVAEGRAVALLTELGPSVQGLRDEILETITQKPGVPGHLGNCSRCGASITDFGKVQELALGVEDKGPINVYAYFCGECKSTYGLVKGEEGDSDA